MEDFAAGSRRLLPRRRLLAAGLGGALLAPAARAQVPAGARPLTLVLPFSPGAPPDAVARILSEALGRRLGQPAVIDNRSGASGNIGAEFAARAAPDGNTLMVHTSTLAMNVSLYRSIPYDPITSFAPVATLVEVDFALVAHTSAATDFAGFLQRARARPGAMNYASPGVGTPHHLCMELFKRQANVELTHVPYRGTAGAVTDLVAGTVGVMFMPAPAAVELARDDRLRILAVAADAHLPNIPAVPTVAEAGVPGVTMRDWFALFAPARTPPDTLRRLNEAINAVLASPEAARALEAQGYTVVGGTPEALRDRVATAVPRWAKVVRDANITAD
ncbi:tripartite tricarboxylate transporter substrate binding protein [Roseomonas sp. BN140053]|uniref:tripartite tricarboxylate transporter substrate binding protein n=1 Tax=Roseomonas sp. BN140053 TaxID=3391898 RepID=UPI0039E9BE21